MHNKILNKYYFINKFDQSHIDKQDKKTAIIYRNYNEKYDEKLIFPCTQTVACNRKEKNLEINFDTIKQFIDN